VFSGDLDATGNLFTCVYGLAFAVVDVYFFLAAVGLGTLLEFDGVLLLDAVLVLAVRGDVGGAGDAGFVTFPSDARSLLGEVDLSLYLEVFSFCDSVTPVRGREDTERNGDAGVKVQIAWSLGVPS
jgi:hypothetical protein